MKTLPTKENTEKIARSINAKRDHFHKKWKRARKQETRQTNYDLYVKYREAVHRAYELKSKVSHKSVFSDTYWSEHDYKVRLLRKEENRQKYLTRHKYSMWFLSESLGADYGEFTCGRCGSTFYHSPSRITLASKVVYDCACGHCTNSIIGSDWNEKPYK